MRVTCNHSVVSVLVLSFCCHEPVKLKMWLLNMGDT